MSRILGIFFALLYFFPAAAQYYNQQENFLKANRVWAFETAQACNLRNGSAQPIQTSIQTFEGCAAVSDPVTGQVLFYSDGWKCWNRKPRR